MKYAQAKEKTKVTESFSENYVRDDLQQLYTYTKEILKCKFDRNRLCGRVH